MWAYLSQKHKGWSLHLKSNKFLGANLPFRVEQECILHQLKCTSSYISSLFSFFKVVAIWKPFPPPWFISVCTSGEKRQQNFHLCFPLSQPHFLCRAGLHLNTVLSPSHYSHYGHFGQETEFSHLVCMLVPWRDHPRGFCCMYMWMPLWIPVSVLSEFCQYTQRSQFCYFTSGDKLHSPF